MGPSFAPKRAGAPNDLLDPSALCDQTDSLDGCSSRGGRFSFPEDERMDLAAYDRIIDLFLAGKLPRMNHARHLDVANILVHLDHGRALVHLGLQVTAIRAGVPEKYSRETTDQWLDRIDGTLPPLDAFDDVR
jgi:hypothetical protein